ncbi:hypothetical protein AAG570_013426 [Ranatra chinensis]|uniref:Uncharacterized protein n=1 Tax=Ranatra chinensis TaxID=642074 RepID=A0ABD0YNS6_9HEMI
MKMVQEEETDRRKKWSGRNVKRKISKVERARTWRSGQELEGAEAVATRGWVEDELDAEEMSDEEWRPPRQRRRRCRRRRERERSLAESWRAWSRTAAKRRLGAPRLPPTEASKQQEQAEGGSGALHRMAVALWRALLLPPHTAASLAAAIFSGCCRVAFAVRPQPSHYASYQ